MVIPQSLVDLNFLFLGVAVPLLHFLARSAAPSAHRVAQRRSSADAAAWGVMRGAVAGGVHCFGAHLVLSTETTLSSVS